MEIKIRCKRNVLEFICVLLICVMVPFSVQAKAPKEMTETVEVEGVGLTRDKALLNAFKSAVRKVVGTLVDAETKVKNNKLIKDQILTYSNGYVTKYDELSAEEDDGAWNVRIRATVSNRKLQTQLQKMGLYKVKVEKSIFAEAATRVDEKKSSARLIVNLLKGEYPGKAYLVSVGKPEVLRTSMDGKVMVKTKISVRFNPDFVDKFEQMVAKMSKKINKKMGIKLVKGKVSLTQNNSTDNKDVSMDPVFFLNLKESVLSSSKKPARLGIKTLYGNFKNKYVLSRKKGYYVVYELLALMNELFSPAKLYFQFAIVGVEGNVLKEYAPMKKELEKGRGYKLLAEKLTDSLSFVVSPFFGIGSSDKNQVFVRNYLYSWDQVHEFPDLETLKNTKEIRVKVMFDAKNLFSKGNKQEYRESRRSHFVKSRTKNKQKKTRMLFSKKRR